jgi:hypothetical protein
LLDALADFTHSKYLREDLPPASQGVSSLISQTLASGIFRKVRSLFDARALLQFGLAELLQLFCTLQFLIQFLMNASANLLHAPGGEARVLCIVPPKLAVPLQSQVTAL